MKRLIDKSAVAAEIERRIADNKKDIERASHKNLEDYFEGYEDALTLFKEQFLDTLEVKEVEECKQPEYSYFETIYQCGKKPRWNIGDTLAYYEFYTDREGEHVLGKVTKVDFDKEQCDWFYTLEGGNVYDEQSLLEDKTYKKN